MLVSTMRELSCINGAEALWSCAGLRAILCKLIRSMRRPLGNRSARGFSPLSIAAPCLPRIDNVCVAVRFPQCGMGTEAICACFQNVSHGEDNDCPSQNCNAQDRRWKAHDHCEKNQRKARHLPALVAAGDAR